MAVWVFPAGLALRSVSVSHMCCAVGSMQNPRARGQDQPSVGQGAINKQQL